MHFEKIDERTIKIEDPINNISHSSDIVDKLTDIARDGFGTGITRDDVINHVLKTDFLYIIGNKENPEGFSSYNRLNIKDSNILYLNGIVMKRDVQKRGTFYRINSLALDHHPYDYIAMRTQNPVIYAATQKITKEIFTCKWDF